MPFARAAGRRMADWTVRDLADLGASALAEGFHLHRRAGRRASSSRPRRAGSPSVPMILCCSPRWLVCSTATVELTRRVGENNGFVKDVHAIWELPVAMLLPLAYAPVLPVIRITLTQWRIRRVPVHRRAFSAAAIGLSYVAAALVFHALIRLAPGAASNPGGHALAWMVFVGGRRGRDVGRQPGPGPDRDQGLGSEREASRGAVRPGAALQRRGRAVRGRARHVLPGQQHNRGGLRVPLRHAAAAVAAACPAGRRLAGRFQDRAAERGDLGAGVGGGGRPRRPDQDAPRGRPAGHRPVQGDQRHLWSPARRPGHQGDRAHAEHAAARLRPGRAVRRRGVLAAAAPDPGGGRLPHRRTGPVRHRRLVHHRPGRDRRRAGACHGVDRGGRTGQRQRA